MQRKLPVPALAPVLASILALLGIAGLAQSSAAQEKTQKSAQKTAAITIAVPGATEIQSQRIEYACGGETVAVEYINAGGVSLAVLSMKDEFVVASNVIAASGARYAGGRFIWWSRGKTADLYDLTKGENAKPVNCRETR